MVPVMLVQLANDVPGWQFRFSNSSMHQPEPVICSGGADLVEPLGKL